VKKLIVQIPCLNEALTLPATLADIPKTIPGIDAVEILIIDDGSRDGTAEVALAHGAHHVVQFTHRRGLAAAFAAGLDACVKLGADFIVNTDGDNQYAGADIPKLLAPLLEGQADMVIGDRNIQDHHSMSPTKKRLQRVGSWVVRQVSNTQVPDTTSGFRAYTREAALRLSIVSDFSYTLETIIQAGKKKMAVAHVPIATNRSTRASRLFGSTWTYIKASAATIVRIYAMYEPLKVFGILGLLVFAGGLSGALRFIYFYLSGTGWGHVQSLVLSAVLMIVGFQIALIGLVADVISGNRKLLEDILYRVRRMELEAGAAGTGDDARRAPRT